MRVGLCTDQNLEWAPTVERWQLFERLGLDSAWVCDHLLQPSRPTGPYFEGWTLLAALAAVTERIRVGVLVTSNTFRHPALLAKEIVTVDHISGGRLDVGLGAGWFEPEHRMFGFDFPEPKELVDRFEEAVRLIDLMLTNDTCSFEGRHYSVKDAITRPRPLQQPRPPFLIGAHRPRMLGIAARHAQTWNSHCSPEELRSRNAQLDEICAGLGRDPRTLERSVYYWVARTDQDPWSSVEAFAEVAGRYQEAGATELIVDHPPDSGLAVLERVAADVLPRLRAGL
ncbi:MAG: LLM class flavin-dependent oxidoreductase [Candidatus Dormibacteraeota bacterium]|nr:LLM class flavin-dependent oxidoreductase [Candidatus Dormibacteraeota bacterium]